MDTTALGRDGLGEAHGEHADAQTASDGRQMSSSSRHGRDRRDDVVPDGLLARGARSYDESNLPKQRDPNRRMLINVEQCFGHVPEASTFTLTGLGLSGSNKSLLMLPRSSIIRRHGNDVRASHRAR